ncbi:TPA: Ig domain-containing protein [Enterococcus faecalis]|nr:Ig domain-containing protein [Enterococcus faecalis]
MSFIPPEKFRLYKKGETNPVAEGVSPLAITGIAANTDVLAGDFTVTGVATVDGVEKESDHVDVPAFKTLPIAVTGITLDKTELALKVGETATLTPTIMPENATNKVYSFSSEDTAIGTVTPVQGKVTGVAEGVTKIVGTTKDGNFTAECTLTVSAAE